jgi:hypothetical protein
VIEAASGNLLTFMVSALNHAAEQKADEEGDGTAELVVRFNFIFSAVIGFVTALMLAACASPSRGGWEYYDQCARGNPSFLAISECGKCP